MLHKQVKDIKSSTEKEVELNISIKFDHQVTVRRDMFL